MEDPRGGETAEALSRRGVLAWQQGRFAEAVELFERLVGAEPGSAPHWLQYAMALKAAGDLRGAGEACGRAVNLAPDLPEGHFALGGVLDALGDDDRALTHLGRALALRPHWAEAENRLGAFWMARGQAAEAEAAFTGAARSRPDWYLPRHNLGQLAMQRGDGAAAIEWLRQAVRLEPRSTASHVDLGGLLLQAGDFAAGWSEFEWRFDAGGQTPRRAGYDAPVWEGRPLHGETVMVWIEQGLGDHLQFCRFARGIAERGGRVWLQAPDPLRRLYAGLGGVERLVGPEEEPGGFDYQVPILSLPKILGVTMDSIPETIPYLWPLAEDLQAIGDLPRTGERLRVGLVWASRPGVPVAAQRDCPLEGLAPITRIPGLRLFAFQFGERAGDLAGHPDLPIVDLSPGLGDFARTAAYATTMDVIVTVDTAMAHLAGALGLATWTLLSEPANWRWLTDRLDSPWYPTMRLFRQPRPGDWASVLREVEAELLRLLGR